MPQRYRLRVFASLTACLIASCSAPSTDATGDRVLFEWPVAAKLQDAMFECSDPKAFRANADGTFELFGKSRYKPKVRSPRCIALLRDVEFSDFVLEAELLQTGKDYGHRDLCLFFGVQSATQFYYVHLATKADDHAHNVFRVDNAPRTKIASQTTAGIDWGRDVWHKVKIEREVSSGAVRVYFDDMETPIMVAEDKTFGIGRIGFGSFDDQGKLRNLRIRGSELVSAESTIYVSRD